MRILHPINHTRTILKHLALASALGIATFMGLAPPAQAIEVWTGPTVSFTKADNADWTLPENQDRITPNVWLTRENAKQLFNIKIEANPGGWETDSPKGTEWAWPGQFGNSANRAEFTAANYANLKYGHFDLVEGGAVGNIVGVPGVVHLISEDIYLEIVFTSWTKGIGGVGQGGGFSYTRSTYSPPEPATMTSFGLPDNRGFIDLAGKTITLTVPMGTDLATLKPAFTVSSGTCDQTSGSSPVPTFAGGNPASAIYTVKDGPITNAYTVKILAFGGTPSGAMNVRTYDTSYGTNLLNPIANLLAVTPSGTGLQTADIQYTDFGVLPGITGNADPNKIDTFSVVWDGWLDVTKAGYGDYTFGTASDDGSVVYADLNDDGVFDPATELVVNNNFVQGTTSRTGTVTLNTNSVHILIGIFEDGGGQSMEARFSPGAGVVWGSMRNVIGAGPYFSPTNPFVDSVAKITSFSPASVIGQPAANAATIAWTVRFGITDMTHLAPAFTLSPGAKCYDKNPTDPTAVEIFSGTHRDFSGAPVHYFVKSLNGLVVNDYTVTVDVGPEAPPLEVTDYARWFDASKIVAADGAPVPTWNDLSPNAANATVPSGNATPAYVANAGTGSGLGAVYFAKNGGATTSAALRFTRDSAIRSVFSVFKGNSFLLTDASAYHFHRVGDDNPVEPIWDSGNSSGNIRGGSTYVNGTLVNGTSFAMPTSLHNGFNLVEVLTTGTVQADSFNKDRVYHAGNQSHAEMLIYDRLLSETERVSVENYLMAKWFGTYTSAAPEAKMLTFGPGATIGAVAANAATVNWAFPYGGNITALAPTFTLSVGAKCYDKNPLTDPTAVELASGTTRDFSAGAVHYFVKSTDYVDLVNDYAVVATETPPSTACRMLTFGLPGYPATIDEGAKTINWMVPFGSLGSLSPEYTVSPLAFGDPVSGTTQNLSAPPHQVIYRVYAEDTRVWQDYLVTASELAVPPGGTSVGPICWYDAGKGVTAAGGTVSAWADQSGMAHHATLGGGTVTVASNQVNSLPELRLRGGGTYLDCAKAMFAKEQYVVVRSPNTTWNGSGSFLGRKGTGNSGARASSYNLASGTTGFWQDHFPTAVSKNGTALPLNQQTANGPGFQLGTITQYMILKIVVDATADAANLAALPFYQIGRNDNLGTMDFDVAEIIGYGSQLSAEDETKLGSYLAAKYGLFTAYPELTPQALIGSFDLAGKSATVNQSARTIAVIAPYGTDLTSLASTFTLSPGATCYSTNPAAPDPVEIVSGGTLLNYSNPVHYFVRSSDLAITNDYTVTVTVAPSSGTLALDVSGAGVGAEILNDGTLVEANHFGQTGAGLTPVTVNGVLFGTSWAHLTSGWNTGGQWTNTDAQNLVTSLSDSTDFGKLMRNYIWTSAGNTRIDIPGLVPGHTYRLQLISSSPRGGNITLEGYAYGPLAPNSIPPMVLSFTWTAADTTANVEITRQSGSYGGQSSEILFNGYALHDVTPASDMAEILTFDFPGSVYPPTVDQSTHAIHVVVPTGADVSNVLPTYTLSGTATCVPTSPPSAGINFSAGPVSYTVTSSGIPAVSKVYTVTVTKQPPVPGGVTGITLWLDASAPSTMTLAGETVNEWRDKMLSGAKMTRKGGAPGLVAAGIGSVPTVHFNNSAWMNDSVNHSTPVTVFYVSRQTGGSNARVLGAENNWLLGYHGAQRNRFHFDGWVNEAGAASDTNPHLFAATIGGTGQNTTVWGDGTQLASNQGGVTGPNNLQLNGYTNSANELSDCDISEVLVYNRILTPSELITVGNYLAGKYKLTTAYPPPASMANVQFPGLGYARPIDGVPTGFQLQVPVGTSVTSLSPTYEVLAGASGSPASGDPRNFTTPQTYRITGADGSKLDYTVAVVPYTGYAAKVMASNPLAFWPLNEGKGLVAYDNSSGNNGAYSGSGVTYGVAGPVGANVVALDGVGGTRVAVPYSAALNPSGPFTAEAWMNPATLVAPGSFQCALSSFTEGNRSGWLIYCSQSGWTFRTYTQNGTTAPTVNITGGTPAVGVWDHVVVVWDGTKGHLYVNGELKATSTDTTYVPSPSAPFSIGARADGAFWWAGKTGDVAFYNRALTAEEIANHYQSPSGYAAWAALYAGNGAANEDSNQDGVQNGVAYFMGMNGLATNPGVVGGKVTWPHVNTVASFQVQVSDNLVIWAPAAAGDVDTVSNPGNVIYTLPPGAPKKFCRLSVTP